MHKQNHQQIIKIKNLFQKQIKQTILQINTIKLHFLQTFNNLKINYLQIIAQ